MELGNSFRAQTPDGSRTEYYYETGDKKKTEKITYWKIGRAHV
jgi:hypothetical protein